MATTDQTPLNPVAGTPQATAPAVPAPAAAPANGDGSKNAKAKPAPKRTPKLNGQDQSEAIFGDTPTNAANEEAAWTRFLDWYENKAQPNQQIAEDKLKEICGCGKTEMTMIDKRAYDDHLIKRVSKYRDTKGLYHHVYKVLKDEQPPEGTHYEPPNPATVVVEQYKVKPTSLPASTVLPSINDDTLKYPDFVLDGDNLSDYMHDLTDGTQIPPAFVRENLKTGFGTLLDGFVGFPSYEDISMRQYNFLISDRGESGKGESWKRTCSDGNPDMIGLLEHYETKFLDGGQFGSGQYMASLFEKIGGGQMLANWDEMSSFFQMAQQRGSRLLPDITSIFDYRRLSAGSLEHGDHVCNNVSLSLSGCFTLDKFRSAFICAGAAGSGFLSRPVLTYQNFMPYTGKWRARDRVKEKQTFNRLADIVAMIRSGTTKFVPQFAPDADALYEEFAKLINNTEKIRDYKARIVQATRKDLLIRAVFSGSKIITLDHVKRSIQWGRHQLLVRQALWPTDAGGPVAAFEKDIVRYLREAFPNGLSNSKLRTLCHVNDGGNNGGYEAFNRAIAALVKAGAICNRRDDKNKMVTTRKGRPIYFLTSEED